MTNLSSFEKAINSLDEIVKIYENDKSAINRDAMIKRFEYTYELSFKHIAKYIKAAGSSFDVQPTFNQIIRLACDYGITASEIGLWKNFKEKRNLTAHTYDENTAETITAVIPIFLKEAKFILERLKYHENY